MLKRKSFALGALSLCLITYPAGKAVNAETSKAVSPTVIEGQQEALMKATTGLGFGPQSPRDLGLIQGNNHRSFGAAPDIKMMNLCNIHIHESAEHRGGEFTTYVGNGDGKGYGTGYKYNGKLSKEELQTFNKVVGSIKNGSLKSGDTIEIHFVYSSAQVHPGPTLASCISKEINNPQLRVETVVGVLVNDRKAGDFTKIAEVSVVNGFHAAPGIPNNLGYPISYAGSTTGPSYNEKGSPFQVTWNVRPKVVKLDILSVAMWLESNPFKEDHAHGVRNLVTNLDLLSPIDIKSTP